MAAINIIILICFIIIQVNSRETARDRMCSYYLPLEGWKLAFTYTRLCRVHCGCFKTSLINFTPSSPKMLSAKHKCVSLLLLMRAKERSSQPATVRPQLSKLKEKHRWEGIVKSQSSCFSFTRKLAGIYDSYISTTDSTSSKLLKLRIPFQLCTGCNETKNRRGEEKPGKKIK